MQRAWHPPWCKSFVRPLGSGSFCRNLCNNCWVNAQKFDVRLFWHGIACPALGGNAVAGKRARQCIFEREQSFQHRHEIPGFIQLGLDAYFILYPIIALIPVDVHYLMGSWIDKEEHFAIRVFRNRGIMTLPRRLQHLGPYRCGVPSTSSFP